MKFKVGDEIYINGGADTPVSWPVKAEILAINSDGDYVVGTYEYGNQYKSTVSEDEIYPDKDSLVKVYLDLLASEDEYFIREKSLFDKKLK